MVFDPRGIQQMVADVSAWLIVQRDKGPLEAIRNTDKGKIRLFYKEAVFRKTFGGINEEIHTK